MRLSDVLSKPSIDDFMQIEGFLMTKKGMIGQSVTLNVGQVALNYHCCNCEDLRTFYSKGKLSCIFVGNNLISIDCVLACACGANVQKWFLVEANNDITSSAPNVRIIKQCERLSKMVKTSDKQYGEFSDLLAKANHAYREGLGSGAIIYLRKIYESITIQSAKAINISYKQYKGGNPKNFSVLLKEVNEKCQIIPSEFSANGYRLFQELSEVVHGNTHETISLSKYEPLHRLVVGILDNVRNRKEYQTAAKALGWAIKQDGKDE